MLFINQPSHVAKLKADPNTKLVETTLNSLIYLGFNVKKAPFDDVKVRQAFAKAVDKPTLIDKVLEGAVVQADTIIPPGMPGFNQSAAKIQDLNVADAKKLLADAGFADGKNFPKVALSINNQDPNYAKIAAAMQQMWKENLGVTVDINTKELAKFNDDLTATANKPDDAAAMSFYISVWGADYPDPQNFVSQQLRTGVGNNNGHYSNAEFDKLVDQADVETDQAKRLQLYDQAETIALTEVGWLPLSYGKLNLLIRSSWVGLLVVASLAFLLKELDLAFLAGDGQPCSIERDGEVPNTLQFRRVLGCHVLQLRVVTHYGAVLHTGEEAIVGVKTQMATEFLQR